MGSFSIWHWLILLLVLGLPISVIVWMSRRQARGVGGQLKGFGGWLLWLAIMIWIAPVRSLINLAGATEGVSPYILARFHLAFDGEMLLYTILIIMQIVTIVLMMKRSWRFVPMFIWMGGYAVLLPLLDVAWGSTIFSVLSGQPVSVFIDAMAAQAVGGFVSTMIGVVVWMLYLTRSRRVANTFVRGITSDAPEPA